MDGRQTSSGSNSSNSQQIVDPLEVGVTLDPLVPLAVPAPPLEIVSPEPIIQLAGLTSIEPEAKRPRHETVIEPETDPVLTLEDPPLAPSGEPNALLWAMNATAEDLHQLLPAAMPDTTRNTSGSGAELNLFALDEHGSYQNPIDSLIAHMLDENMN